MTDFRIPTGEQESFAWGFLIGYMGEVPDEMKDAFEWDDPSSLPESIELSSEDALAWRRGYDAGCATYSDHSVDD